MREPDSGAFKAGDRGRTDFIGDPASLAAFPVLHGGVEEVLPETDPDMSKS
jgi:hypothetical protein